MERDELRKVIKETVKETLISLGMDACNPIEMQKDLAFARELRQTVDKVKNKGIIAAVGVIVVAILGLIWIGIKSILC